MLRSLTSLAVSVSIYLTVEIALLVALCHTPDGVMWPGYALIWWTFGGMLALLAHMVRVNE